MPKNAIPFALTFCVLACAAPQRPAPAPPSSDLESLKADVRKLQESVAHLDNSLGHLRSELSAESADDELMAMTIDATEWSTKTFDSGEPREQPILLCHVVEWNGYGKMLRFTRKADPVFVFEAEGQPGVDARMATGGICDEGGNTRFVILSPATSLQSGVRYQLRPRNKSEKYRWSVPEGLTVVAPNPGG